jgi:hypothetical protein
LFFREIKAGGSGWKLGGCDIPADVLEVFAQRAPDRQAFEATRAQR